MILVVRSLWPRARVKPFGSFVSGLSLPSSDLDLVICMPKVHQESAPEASGALEGRNAVKETWQQNLARGLRNEKWVDVHSIKIIRNTAVPVLKFKTVAMEGQSCVSLDISFESQGHRGLESNKLVSSLMQKYSPLRPLVLVLKAFLTTRYLCEAFTGGISSYALLLITTRFLQEMENSELNDTGAILLGILKFIGEDFDPRYTGISISRSCYFPRALGSSMEQQHGGFNQASLGFIPFKFDPLFIEDPLTPGNNVGRNCFRVLQVLKTFSEAYDAIVSVLRSSERDGVAQPLLERIVGKY
jgi:DNA polymerase sigma